MTVTTFLKAAEKFEIQVYKRPKNLKSLMDTHVAFTGYPGKHPYDTAKVVIVADPCSSSTFYYEFNARDISYAEELPSLVNPLGESISQVRIWVKKGSLGIRMLPFLVEDIG